MNANDILMGGGKAAKFAQVGATVSGTVAREPEARQQTDFRTGVGETWKDGSPKMQILVQLQTQERDQDDPSDDGIRTLYIKGRELTNAIRQAVRQSGANGIHAGGQLTVQYVGDGQAAQAGLSAPKLYAAQYTPPAASMAGVAAPMGATPEATRPAAQQPSAAPVGQAPAGIDPAMWARLDPEQRARVQAAAIPY